MEKVAYFSNTDFSLYNFRKELMLEMKKRGFDVFAVAPVTNREIVKKIEKEGIRFVNIPLKRGLDFWGRDLVYFLRVLFLCRREGFFLCHNFTIKPCIFATLAQKLAGVKNIYCTITGLGAAFEKEGPLKKLGKILYKPSLRFTQKVIFQNPEDRDLFLGWKIVKKEKVRLVLGSGVDPKEFSLLRVEKEKLEKLKKEINYQKNNLLITFIGRMLWSKGVGDFVKSAEILRKKLPHLKFLLVGSLDKENPSRILEEDVKEWEDKNLICYLKERKDIKEILALTDIFVFPSCYREGLPRVLLEAGAMERAMVATDIPGVREVIKDRENGFLVKPNSPHELAKKIEILAQNPSLRKKFGKKTREIIEKEFNVEKVVRETIELYNL